MKPDLDKIRTLGNELKCMLETSNKFIKDSWLQDYENWLRIGYDGRRLADYEKDNFNWQKCNIFFRLNDNEYYVLFIWEKTCIDNFKNKTLVTKENSRRKDKEEIDIWRAKSNKKMWLIYVCPSVERVVVRPDNVRYCSYKTLLSFFRTKL